MINNDNFIIWLEGYMDALESKGVEKIETSIIRNKLKTINLQHFARKLYSQNSEDGIKSIKEKLWLEWINDGWDLL